MKLVYKQATIVMAVEDLAGGSGDDRLARLERIVKSRQQRKLRYGSASRQQWRHHSRQGLTEQQNYQIEQMQQRQRQRLQAELQQQVDSLQGEVSELRGQLEQQTYQMEQSQVV
ncbi:hypothetical protein MKD32_08565 [Shewanella xiamenensis]|nr:YbgF trimerization domain-containing protein [Shewanella xiamenensis]UML95327.1 hypothetical protein MKD32_08565 [Shewanella xiamenensis]